jgi:hypothetical protein
MQGKEMLDFMSETGQHNHIIIIISIALQVSCTNSDGDVQQTIKKQLTTSH